MLARIYNTRASTCPGKVSDNRPFHQKRNFKEASLKRRRVRKYLTRKTFAEKNLIQRHKQSKHKFSSTLASLIYKIAPQSMIEVYFN